MYVYIYIYIYIHTYIDTHVILVYAHTHTYMFEAAPDPPQPDERVARGDELHHVLPDVCGRVAEPVHRAAHHGLQGQTLLAARLNAHLADEDGEELKARRVDPRRDGLLLGRHQQAPHREVGPDARAPREIQVRVPGRLLGPRVAVACGRLPRLSCYVVKQLCL